MNAFSKLYPSTQVDGWYGGVYFKRTTLHFFSCNEDRAMGMKDQSTFKYFRDPSDNRKPGLITINAGGGHGGGGRHR